MKSIYSRGLFLLSILFFLKQSVLFAQLCDPTVPLFTADLTGNPDSLWQSSDTIRKGLCCSASSPDRCVQFSLTLDPQAVGIKFTVCEGALPPGALYYQIDCGPQHPVGEPLCLSGGATYTVTFCKPGSNVNQYCIQSIGKPKAGPPIAVSNGCQGDIYATGYNESTVVWTSVFPGPPGTYNSYLGCTAGCDTTHVTAQPGYPDSVLYQVSGTPLGGCAAITVLDTVTVYFITDKTATILPINPIICAGASNAVLTANGGGGAPPYSYLWSNGATTQSITVGVGTYSVIISDTTNCPPAYDTVVVNSSPKPVADFNFTPACATATMTFIDASTVSSGTIAGWSWDFGDGNTSTAQNPTHIYPSTGTYTVTLISNTATGCYDTISKTINVTPLPVVGFVTNTPCYIDSVHFTNTSTLSSGTFSSWSWSFGDGGTSVQQNPYHYYSVSGTDTVTLIGTSVAGCSDTIQILVNIQPTPKANFSAYPVCENIAVSFKDSSTIISGTITNWAWDFGDGNTSTQQNPSHTYVSTGSYPVTLIVTSAANCKDTITQNLTVNPTPVTSFSSNTPCYIDSVSFSNNTTLSSGTISSWNWDFGDTTTSTLQNPNHYYSFAGIHSVTLIALTAFGCSDTLTQLIDVEPKPKANFNAFPVCENKNVPFTDSSTIISGTITNWDWDFGDGATSTQQNPMHIYPAIGTYTVTLIVTSASNCKDTVTKILTVNPSPVASFVSNTPCYIDSVSFINGTTLSSGTISSWNWDFGDTTTNSTLQNPNHYYAFAGIHSVTLVAVTAFGCSDTITQLIDVEPKPKANFNAFPVCENRNVPFTDSSTIISGAIINWDWDFGDGATSTQQNPPHIYPSIGTYTVTLIVTSAANCKDTVTKTLTVNPTPVAAFISNTPCYIDSVSFSNNSTLSSGTFASWSWNFGDTTTNSTLQNPNHYYSFAGFHSVTLIAVSAFGCADTVTQLIDVEPRPKANFNAFPVCENRDVPFTDSSTIISGNIVNWNWDFGDGATGTLQNPLHMYPALGTYNVTLIVTSAANCTDTITKTLTVNPTPVADFTSFGLCLADGTNFSDASTVSSGSIITWNWIFGDGNGSSTNNPFHIYPSTGNYGVTLIVTTTDGCSDTTIKNITINPSPTAGFTASPTTVNLYQDINFADQSNGAVTWIWNFGDSIFSSLANPTHNYTHGGGTISVMQIVINSFGCPDTTFKDILITMPPLIPNAFTPNGDGNNDNLYVSGGPFTSLDFKIYNNWGELIFVSTRQSNGWDGRRNGMDQPIGVYVYTLTVKTEDGKEYHFKGDVTLLR